MNTNSKFQDAINSMRNLGSAFEQLTEKLKEVSTVPMMADKPGVLREKKKTKKGAKHISNPSFRPRHIMVISPADYRRRHMGNPYKAMKQIVKEGVLNGPKLVSKAGQTVSKGD